MSDTVTHSRGAESPLNLITGEPPGIKEILERRAAEGNPPADDAQPAAPDPTSRPEEEDAATKAAKEVASLTRRATEAEARAIEADRARVAAENARRVAVEGAEDTGFTAINTALAAVTQEKASLIAELRTAGEAGDFAKMGEINVRLGEIGGELRDLQQGQREFERERQARIDRPRQVEQSQLQPSSATERQILANLNSRSKEHFLQARTPQTRDFLYQHPEFFTDRAVHDRMVGADLMAVGRGIQRDTPEYFAAVREAAMGTTTSNTQPTRREPTERSATPGAAPSREAPGPTGRRLQAGDVYVSPEQKTTALWMGVDPVEYAREEAELKNRGELPYRRR